MEATKTKKFSRPSPELDALCNAADEANRKANTSREASDYRAAESACLAAALQANREGAGQWANEYGRISAQMKKRACGG